MTGGWEEMEKSSCFHPSKKTELDSWVPATPMKEHGKQRRKKQLKDAQGHTQIMNG